MTLVAPVGHCRLVLLLTLPLSPVFLSGLNAATIKDMNAAARVGAMVIAVGAMGLYAGQFLRTGAGPEARTYTAVFEDAGGLAAGSKVMFAGVEVGRVKTVGLTDDAKAEVVLQVKKDLELRQGVEALVPTSLVSIGVTELRLVQARPGTSPHDPSLPLTGRLQDPLEEIVPDFEPTLAEVNKTLASVQTLLADRELKAALVGTLKESQGTARDVGQLVRRIDGLVAENQATARKSLITASNALTDLQKVTSEFSKLVASGQMQEKTLALLDSLNASAVRAEKLVADVQSLTSDPELRASLKETLENVRVASDSAPKLATNMEQMTANGVVISEETVALMKKANEIAENVQGLIDKFNQTVDRIEKGSGSLLPNVQLEADAIRTSGPDRIRTDVNARIPIGRNEHLNIGLYDAFESNKINAQISRPFGPKTDLRYGVYAGQPGVGVDSRVSSRLGVRADLFGLNQTQLDAKLRYEFGQGVNGWFGVERLFDRNRLAVGVGIRR